MVTGTCYVAARRLKATLPIRHEVVGYWSQSRLGEDIKRALHLRGTGSKTYVGKQGFSYGAGASTETVGAKQFA
jgi:hypothetical protein